jgi:hypothetical protein
VAFCNFDKPGQMRIVQCLEDIGTSSNSSDILCAKSLLASLSQREAHPSLNPLLDCRLSGRKIMSSSGIFVEEAIHTKVLYFH